ncbi:MAG: SMR family transporter [Pseudomonadota bacterium]
MPIFIVILCSIIEAFAQISLKISTSAGKIWIAAGLSLFIVEAVLYTYALQSLDISTAYPLGALCFAFSALLANKLLHEHLNRDKIFGIILIIGGCFLISL